MSLSRLDTELKQFLSLLYNNDISIISNTILSTHWKLHWKRSKESTSSSMSGLYFEHYPAQINSNMLTEFLYKLINIAIWNKALLERW